MLLVFLLLIFNISNNSKQQNNSNDKLTLNNFLVETLPIPTPTRNLNNNQFINSSKDEYNYYDYKKEDKLNNLKECIKTAELLANDNFIIICKQNNLINGGRSEICNLSTPEYSIDYMYIHYLRETVFKGILKKLELDKEECFKLYSK